MASRSKRNRWALLEKPGAGARVIGHLRVSSSMQIDKFSLPEQKRKIEELASEEGWLMVGWCEEPGLSAKDDFDSRPEWKHLIFERAGNECDVILCHDSKRWCRNQAYDILSLEELRRKGIWWQSIEDRFDINSDLEPGKDVVIGVSRVQKASFIRDLAREVHKGKEGRARKGYTNGFPPFGYRYPTMTLINGKRPTESVFEPHPTYFPTLLVIGQLLIVTPLLSCGEIARRLNAEGHRYATYTHPEKETPFTGYMVWRLLEKAYYRAYSPESNRGTIITPEGAFIEGKHKAAWSYELWEQIERTRMDGRTVYERVGNRARNPHMTWPRAFAGLISCAHCFGKMRSGAAFRKGKNDAKLYYRCTAKHDARPCKTSEILRANPTLNNGHASMREELVTEQMGVLLDRMAARASQVLEILQTQEEQRSDEPAEVPFINCVQLHTDLEEQKKRAVKAWIKCELTEQEKDQIIAEINAEIARLPHLDKIGTPTDAKRSILEAVESAAELWRATEQLPADRKAANRQAAMTKLFEPFGIYCDTLQHQIVGLRPIRTCYDVITLLLAEHGWQERSEGLLWCDLPDLPQTSIPQTLLDKVYLALEQGHSTTRSIAKTIAYHGPLQNISLLLVRAWQFGLVSRERTSFVGKGGYFYRYTLIAPFEVWRDKPWYPNHAKSGQQ